MKRIIAVATLVVIAFSCYAQTESDGETSFGSRIFTGGSLGLQFGTYTLVEVAPIIGYKVTEKFTPGISLTYIYLKYKDPSGYYPDYSTNIYGGSIFARYYFLENIFGHVECEILNLDVPNTTSAYYVSGYHRQNVAGIFVGGGYREAIGERSSLNILLLYDVNQDPFSPYQNPIIKIGFGFGI